MFRFFFLVLVGGIGLIPAAAAPASIFRVSIDGEDHPDIDGVTKPWKSIGYALSRIPEAGNARIEVATGRYPRVSTTKRFEQPVHIVAENRFQASIISDEERGPFTLIGARNLVLDGFIIDNRNNDAISNTVHIVGGASEITIKNCIITHGDKGYPNADGIKIHRDVKLVFLEHNFIFNAMDEEIELTDWVHDITIRDNVIWRGTSPPQNPIVSLNDRVWRVFFQNNLIGSTHQHSQSLVQFGSSHPAPRDVADLVLLNNCFIHKSRSPLIKIWICENLLMADNTVYQWDNHPLMERKINSITSHFLLENTNHIMESFPNESIDIQNVEPWISLKNRLANEKEIDYEPIDTIQLPDSLNRFWKSIRDYKFDE